MRKHRFWRLGAALLPLAVLSFTACGPAPQSRPQDGLRIILARHGQTDWNLERRLQGWTDRHLNETGKQQAAALAEKLRGIPVEKVYSSTLARSRETAEIARGAAPLESLDGLREQRIGAFEGMQTTTDTLRAREFERRSNDPTDTLDGGESEDQFYGRVSETIRGIVARHPSGTILVVGHGGTNQMVLRALLELTREQSEKIRQANDEVYAIDIRAGVPAVLWKSIGAANLSDL